MLTVTRKHSSSEIRYEIDGLGIGGVISVWNDGEIGIELDHESENVIPKSAVLEMLKELKGYGYQAEESE